jgi:LysM repeat protein
MSNGKRAGRGEPSPTLIPSTTLPTETSAPIAQSTPAPTPATTTPTTPASQPSTMPPLPGTTGVPGPSDPASPASTTPAPAASAPATTSASSFGSIPADLAPMFASAERAQAQNKLLEARTNLNAILLDPRTSAKDREGLRAWIGRLNTDLVFSPTVFPGDTLVETYKVSSGDNLARIAKKTGAVTEPALLARVNRLTNPNALHVGQSLKVVRGPFHAVVSKSAFRMDVYAGPVPSASSLGERGLPDGAEPGWTYIASYPVGLGKDSGTPIANFIVKENKLINPTWANPRTGEKFAADDPKNPIGERWIGLAGLDEKSKGFEKYGIHGTVEAESIGAEMSMGCVRMRAADVEVVYELLMPRVSVVKIVP